MKVLLPVALGGKIPEDPEPKLCSAVDQLCGFGCVTSLSLFLHLQVGGIPSKGNPEASMQLCGGEHFVICPV